jgi:hypothetical protein
VNTVVALAIAGVKATLVVLFFMHVKYGTRLPKLAIVAALYWLGMPPRQPPSQSEPSLSTHLPSSTSHSAVFSPGA